MTTQIPDADRNVLLPSPHYVVLDNASDPTRIPNQRWIPHINLALLTEEQRAELFALQCRVIELTNASRAAEREYIKVCQLTTPEAWYKYALKVRAQDEETDARVELHKWRTERNIHSSLWLAYPAQWRAYGRELTERA